MTGDEIYLLRLCALRSRVKGDYLPLAQNLERRGLLVRLMLGGRVWGTTTRAGFAAIAECLKDTQDTWNWHRHEDPVDPEQEPE